MAVEDGYQDFTSARNGTKRVLCVDANFERFFRSKELFRRKGYTAVWATTEAEIVAVLKHARVDAVILDCRIPDSEAIASYIRRLHPVIPIILLTGYCQEPSRRLSAMVHRTLFKGGPLENLIWVLEQQPGSGRRPRPRAAPRLGYRDILPPD